VKEQRRPYLQFQDINFDGSSDLHVFDNAGGTGNFWCSVWLFDTKTKGFVFSKPFSNICAPKVDAKAKEIVSFNNLGGLTSFYGYCDEYVIYYKAEGNKLKEVRSIFNHAEKCDEPNDSVGCPCVTYKSELIGNKWKRSTLGEWDVSLYDSIYQK
jgi:hypothetical protein